MMRAYSDVYLGDVVENQGKLFDYVANTYPDKDTEDFINAYMTSKTRQSIDQAKAYVNTMDAKELWEYFEARKSNGRFYTKLDWRILCILSMVLQYTKCGSESES